jgi:phosphopantothenoylcysteine synthetase/decarboxylase
MADSDLEGRRLLVTAGPTWVRIDPVRHLGNVSSGATGLEIARALARAGGKVTLLLGPARVTPTAEDEARLAIRPFVTFDELHELVRRHVASHAYDAMVHTAAVSDYRPVAEEKIKISSDCEELVLRLRRTPKIVDEVKSLDPQVILVKFKLEVDRTREELLSIAQESRARSEADLMVANDLSGMAPGRHLAYLLDADGVIAHVETTAALAARLAEELTARLSGSPLRSALPPTA